MVLIENCERLISHCWLFFFQYNCISLGLTVGAIASVLSDKDLVACVLYCLALSHKQVSSNIHQDYSCFIYLDPS